ncbi:MAG: amino acid permease [Alphaproteobacteria bacterium]|nr:amino acid permease [Alphaproteobacteria bacterium]
MVQTNSPRPSLGIWRATSLVTGNIVGVGLFMLPASLGVFGTVGLLGWLLTAAGSICLALVFARLSHAFPKIGGPYAYSREAFGDFVGFQMAWSYWVGTWASNAAIAIAFVSYLSFFWPELNQNTSVSFLFSLATVWLFTIINIIGVQAAGTIQLITTILKVAPLAIIVLFGMPYIQADHFLPINPSEMPFWTAISTAAALTLFSFVGLESATIPAEDVENPEKTIPRATILGTLLAAVIYISTMVVILGMLSPQELSQSTAPFADAATRIFGDIAGPLFACAAIFSTLGTLNGWILLQGQMPVAAARDKLFPSFFDKHTRNGSPYMALIISSSLMSAMLYMNYEAGLVEQFTAIVSFTSFAILLPYLYSTVAELYIMMTQPHHMSKAKFIRTITIALLAFCYTILITIGAGENAVYTGMIFIFSGFPFYVWMKRGHLSAEKKGTV